MSVAATVAPFVESLTVRFIAVEKLSEQGRPTGVVWTSNPLGRFRRLAVVFRDGTDEHLVNGTGGIERLALRNGTRLVLEMKSQDDRYFEEGSEFQFVAYLTHGGFMRGHVTVPLVAAT
jgi:hypothetical protein